MVEIFGYIFRGDMLYKLFIILLQRYVDSHNRNNIVKTSLKETVEKLTEMAKIELTKELTRKGYIEAKAQIDAFYTEWIGSNTDASEYGIHETKYAPLFKADQFNLPTQTQSAYTKRFGQPWEKSERTAFRDAITRFLTATALYHGRTETAMRAELKKCTFNN